MELLIIIGLVLLNGIFAMSEMSLVSMRKFKLENLKRKGSSNAKTALALSENPTRFLSTVQIGITLIGVLLGVYSGDTITKDFTRFLGDFAVLQPHASTLASVLIVIFVTYLSIVLGELLPKRLAMTFPEPIIMFLAKPMAVLSKLTAPFVWLLSTSNNLLLKLLGIKNKSDETVTEEEIKSIIAESTLSGEIQEIEEEIVRRVFELGDRKVISIMTHRPDIVMFNVNDTWEDIKRVAREDKHSAYPVCGPKGLDDMLGMVIIKDILTEVDEEGFKLIDFIKKPVYFNENTDSYRVLEAFKKGGIHYGFVMDEYGMVSGIVTMDDVLDALVGDVSENSALEQEEIRQRTEDSWLVDGQYSAFEFIKYFNLDLDYELTIQYSTVAGLFMYHFGNVPNEGDKLLLDGYELEVIDKDGHRIDKILITKL